MEPKQQFRLWFDGFDAWLSDKNVMIVIEAVFQVGIRNSSKTKLKLYTYNWE